ncbi:MAG: DUF427 domain-containing protein [Hyphomicrobiaceae bacterium]
MSLLRPSPLVIAARHGWRWTGVERPPFAEAPAPGQRSVWDFPRPPEAEDVDGRVEVRLGATVIAMTTRARRVLETSHPPTYYIPPADVDLSLITVRDDASHCEWKGFSCALDAGPIDNAGWMLRSAYVEFAHLLGWLAFYPQKLDCSINGDAVMAQPGAYYGGWITPDLAGPFKGAPGSGDW